MEDKKLLMEVKVYEDGTVTINGKPLSEYVKKKIEAELKGSSKAEITDLPGEPPEEPEDVNIFLCNNCPK